jgi:hypothetical protein
MENVRETGPQGIDLRRHGRLRRDPIAALDSLNDEGVFLNCAFGDGSVVSHPKEVELDMQPPRVHDYHSVARGGGDGRAEPGIQHREIAVRASSALERILRS